MAKKNMESFAKRINMGEQINPVLRWNSDDVAGTITMESGIYPADLELFDREFPCHDVCEVFGDTGKDWWNDPMSDDDYLQLIKIVIIDGGTGDPLR